MLNRSLARAARLRSARSASSLTTEDVSLLIERVGSTREVHELIDYYAAAAAKGPNSKVAAVVKVGGDYLADAAAMRELSASLATLSRAGMQPIVVHGAGSQLNDRLASEGIESEFIGGQRVTTPAILNIAKRVFREHNDRLVGAIEAAGARARPIGSSAIEAIAANPALGLVGDIDVSGLNVDVIRNCARDGCIPVICSLGETGEGQVLNVNADVLAKTVALATGAKHVVHINDDGGLKDKSGRKIRSLNFPDEYEALAKEEWARPAFTLQLEQFRDVLESLGDASTVLVTRPAGLLPHFFSTRGLDLAEGTTLRRTDGVQVVRSLDSPRLDLEKLTALLERSFSAESGKRLKLKSDHYDRIKSRVHAVYFSPSYRSAAIVLSDDADKKTFYLDKFALAPTTGDANAPAFGHADQLWDRMRADLPTLFWRSANTMRLDEWFLSRCDGAMRTVALAEMDDTRGTVPSAGSVAAVAKAAAVQQAAAPALPSWTGLGAAVASTASGHATGPSSTAGVVSARAAETALRSVKTVIPPWTVFWYGLDSPVHPHRKDLVGQVQRIGLEPRSFVRAEADAITAAAHTALPVAILDRRRKKVGIVGARGFTGAELVRILASHPSLEIAHASSRALAGERVLDSIPLSSDVVAQNEGLDALRFEMPTPDVLLAPENADVDVWILAMPNGFAGDYVANARATGAALVDLSADHRFVCGANDEWSYGLPELTRSTLGQSSKFVANPGCYATGSQLALAPLVRAGLIRKGASPRIFGVSGYSGAGTTPSPKNDPVVLKDNLIPYALTGHIHEREVSAQLGVPVTFMPHVAPHFRGISLTVSADLASPIDGDGVHALYEEFYGGEPLVKVHAAGYDETPLVQDIANEHHVALGGFIVDEAQEKVVVLSCIDNLLKGAATQAVQNANLILGLPELEGIPTK